MRITKRQLRQIIKEEKAKLIAETKVRKLVRRKLRENAPGQAVGVSLYDDGWRSEVVAVDANGNEVGPKVSYNDAMMGPDPTSPENVATWKKIVSMFGDMTLHSVNVDGWDQELVGHPFTKWLYEFLQDLIGVEELPDFLQAIGLTKPYPS